MKTKAISSKKWACVVTFEFDSEPPVTWRGVVPAKAAETAAARAMRAAKKAHPKRQPRSLVIVLMPESV